MKKLILFSILILTLYSCKKSTTNAQDTRPNIVLILCDDLGYSDVGFNGSKDIMTPELDKLANAGTIFTSAYVSHPFCGPSRAAIMTGRYPHEFGAQFNLPQNSGKVVGTGVPLSEKFMSNVLHDAGYYTGIMGKWHLGAVPNYRPNERGFDDFYGFLGGGHNYFPNQFTIAYKKQIAIGNKNIRDYITPLNHNGKDIEETEYVTDALSREAVRFVNDASKKDQPFFLYLAYNAPHVPLEAKAEDLEKFTNIMDKDRKTFAAMVYAVDRGVGKLVEALKSNNKFDNTLIVFLSDNGGNTLHGATNFPLKGRKGDTYEGGFRVPMFFHWPNKVAVGKHYDYPVSSLDFYPTFAGLAKAKIPKGKKLDGKDIWKEFILGKNIRKGESIYAMRHRSGYSDVGVRQDQWKATKAYNGSWSLYNIDKDIAEKIDLSKENPAQLKKMVLEAQKWSKGHVEPLWFDPLELSEVWKETEMAKFKETFSIK